VKDFALPLYLIVCHALRSDHLPVLIDTIRRSSFHDPLDRPEFSRTDWATYQASIDDRLPWNTNVHDKKEIGKFTEEMTSAILAAVSLDRVQTEDLPI
jgi:hypothetical protein